MHVQSREYTRVEEKCYKIESYAVRKEKNQKYLRKQLKHDTAATRGREREKCKRRWKELRSERKLCEQQLSHAHLTHFL